MANCTNRIKLAKIIQIEDIIGLLADSKFKFLLACSNIELLEVGAEISRLLSNILQ